MIDTAHCW